MIFLCKLEECRFYVCWFGLLTNSKDFIVVFGCFDAREMGNWRRSPKIRDITRSSRESDVHFWKILAKNILRRELM